VNQERLAARRASAARLADNQREVLLLPALVAGVDVPASAPAPR